MSRYNPKTKELNGDEIGFSTVIVGGDYFARKVGWIILHDPKYIRDLYRSEGGSIKFSRGLIECIKGLDFCDAHWNTVPNRQ